MKQQKTAVILAGGKSTRMKKTHKALLPFKNKTILEYVIDAVSDYDEIIIIANDPEPYEQFGLKVIADIYNNKGPLGGIHSGLVHAKHEKVLVVACDMPFANKKLASQMKIFDEPYEVLVSFDGTDIHPLFAIYDKSCLPIIEEHLQEDKLKLLLLLKEFKTVVMDWTKYESGSQVKNWFENVNTPYDYRKLLEKTDKVTRVMCIVGASNTGKTSLIEKVIPIIKAKGYRLGTIKHSHKPLEFENTRKDNIKHYNSGADTSILTTKTGYVVVQRTEKEAQLKKLLELMVDVDIILIEGYKSAQYPRIEIVRQKINNSPICDPSNLKAIVTDLKSYDWNCKTMNLDDANSIADFIIEELKL